MTRAAAVTGASRQPRSQRRRWRADGNTALTGGALSGGVCRGARDDFARVAFGYSAGQAGAAGRYAVLAEWLAGHGLRYGLGGASSNVVTVDSGGRVTVAAATVRSGRVVPLLYQSSVAAYQAGRGAYQAGRGAYRAGQRDARFVVVGAPADGGGYGPEDIPEAAVAASFGMPTDVYRFDGFTVYNWNVNLLTKLHK